MIITEEMIAEDEKRWHDRNIVAELGYCGKNIRHRKNITNDDIRFYAYIMRKAHAMLKEQEAVKPIRDDGIYRCGNCKQVCVGYEVEFTHRIIKVENYCHKCGKAVKWE